MECKFTEAIILAVTGSSSSGTKWNVNSLLRVTRMRTTSGSSGTKWNVNVLRYVWYVSVSTVLQELSGM